MHPAALEYYRAQGLPTPSVEIAPAVNSPFTGNDSTLTSPAHLNSDPQLATPDAESENTKQVQKPAYNSVPIGPGDTWKLESGDLGTKEPSLADDGSLPDAEDNLRLRLPMPK